MKKICVLSNTPVFNDGRVKKMIKTYAQWGQVDFYYIDGTEADTQLFDAHVRLFSFPFSPKNDFLSKLVSSIFFWNQFMFFYKNVKSLNKQYDIVVANDLPTLKPAAKIAALHPGCKLIYDSHEIFLATLNQFFPQKSSPVKSIIFSTLIFLSKTFGKWVEKKYVLKVDFFITVNESIAQFFQKQYGIKKVYSIKNCPERKAIRQEEIVPIRAQFNLKNSDVLFLYQGVINYGRALDIFIKAFAKTPVNYHFFIIGYGSLKAQLEDLVLQLNLTDRVHFLGTVPHESLYRYTSAFDFGVNMGGGNLSKDFGLSNKLFEYMHAGIPVLSTRNPENELIFKKYNIGYLTDNSIEDVVKGLNYLASKSSHDFHVAACKKAAEEYDWNSEVEKLCHFLRENI